MQISHQASRGLLSFLALFLIVSGIFTSRAIAQAYPTRPVRLVISFPPGGGTDLVGRAMAKRIAAQMGQSMVPDNRPGGGGNIAAEVVAKSPADGYTLLLTTNSITVNATLYSKLNYDLVRDLSPISLVAVVPLVLVVHPSVPARNIQELVALAKKRKGQLNFGSNGSGTTSHLSGVLLNMQAGTETLHVPFRGGGPVMTALMSGEVDMGFAVSMTVKPFVDSGRLRAIAVTTAKRAAIMPDVPTMASVFPGFETNVWHGFFAPKGTPANVISQLHGGLMKALNSPEVQSVLESGGAEAVGTTPAAFEKIIVGEVRKYAKIIRISGAKAE